MISSFNLTIHPHSRDNYNTARDVSRVAEDIEDGTLVQGVPSVTPLVAAWMFTRGFGIGKRVAR